MLSRCCHGRNPVEWLPDGREFHENPTHEHSYTCWCAAPSQKQWPSGLFSVAGPHESFTSSFPMSWEVEHPTVPFLPGWLLEKDAPMADNDLIVAWCAFRWSLGEPFGIQKALWCWFWTVLGERCLHSIHSLGQNMMMPSVYSKVSVEDRFMGMFFHNVIKDDRVMLVFLGCNEPYCFVSNLCASRPLFINDLSADVNDWGVSHTHFHQTKMVRSLKSKPDQMLNQGQRLHIMNWGDDCVLFQYPLPPNDPNSSHCVWWIFSRSPPSRGMTRPSNFWWMHVMRQGFCRYVIGLRIFGYEWRGLGRLRCRRKRRFQVLLQSYWKNYIYNI